MIFRRHHIASVVAVALTFATAIFACKPAGNSMNSWAEIDASGWAYGSKLLFTPEMTDSVASGTLSVALCHDNRYPYNNLWLEIEVIDSLSTTLDTVNIVLADKMGHWKGSGIGTDFQLQVPVIENLTINRPAQFNVRHIMRDDKITGLQRIGLIFTENEQ